VNTGATCNASISAHGASRKAALTPRTVVAKRANVAPGIHEGMRCTDRRVRPYIRLAAKPTVNALEGNSLWQIELRVGCRSSAGAYSMSHFPGANTSVASLLISSAIFNSGSSRPVVFTPYAVLITLPLLNLRGRPD
jgi:hypothetical protein